MNELLQRVRHGALKGKGPYIRIADVSRRPEPNRGEARYFCAQVSGADRSMEDRGADVVPLVRLPEAKVRSSPDVA